ncbi:MAG: hypothetical protein RL092_342 [Bacteroidota bacterium]|jgi:hypothetical protein
MDSGELNGGFKSGKLFRLFSRRVGEEAFCVLGGDGGAIFPGSGSWRGEKVFFLKLRLNFAFLKRGVNFSFLKREKKFFFLKLGLNFSFLKRRIFF